MTIRIKRLADGVIFSHTEVLAKKKGFIVFDAAPEKKVVIKGETPKSLDLEDMSRKQVGEFILNRYDIQIPKMGRKTVDILADAYKIIEEFAEKDKQDKENAEHKEAHDRLQKDRAQSKLNAE